MKIRFRPALPAPACSSKLLLRVLPAQIAMFRFLLEGYDNLALFSVLDSRIGLLKLFYSPHQEKDVQTALDAISKNVSLTVQAWPKAIEKSESKREQGA